MLKAYLKYRRERVNAHGLHSPFVFEFYNEILKKSKSEFDPAIEELRAILLKSSDEILFTEMGAGSRKVNSPNRSIREIAKHSATNRKFGGLLARICGFYNVQSVLEIGTSLGIGTAYLAKNSKSVITLEGCPNVARIAEQNLKKLKLDHVHVRVGEFTDSLRKLNSETQKYDLVYIDGNHQFEPTLAYFEFALNHSHDDTFIIFDDIHWSDAMERAWQKIIKDERVNVSIDLFRLGIVCKRPGQRKQDFIVKY